MNKLQIIYGLLRVRDRIPNRNDRYMYLHHQWGMKQADIAICDGKSQSSVSIILKKASKEITNNDIMELSAGQWTIDDMLVLQNQPREILRDNEFMAFVMDVLKLEVSHPLFHFWKLSEYKRITALASLGIQPSFIGKLFNRTSANISMISKRHKNTVEMKYDQRYQDWYDYHVHSTKKNSKPKFVLAGGIIY